MFDVDKSFVSYISAKRNSGKSYLMVQMLMSPKFLKNKFDEVILVDPTYEYDQKYHLVKFSEVYTEFSQELCHELNERLEKGANDKKNRLIIFDDCITSAKFKSNNADHPLNTLILNGRHWNTSVFILSQKYNAISSHIRAQLDYVIFFGSRNHKELKSLHEEYGTGDLNSFVKMLNGNITEPHDFIVIDNIENKILKNFKYVIN